MAFLTLKRLASARKSQTFRCSADKRSSSVQQLISEEQLHSSDQSKANQGHSSVPFNLVFGVQVKGEQQNRAVMIKKKKKLLC